MPLEEEISFEEMHNIEIRNISNLIVRAYTDAKNKKSCSQYATIKGRWEFVQKNSDKDYFLTYMQKYNNGDMSIRKPLQDYLAYVMLDESADKNGILRGKLALKEFKLHYPIVTSVLFGMSAAFNLFLAVPALASFLVWFNMKGSLTLEERQAYFNEAFSDVDIERLKELPPEYLQEAMLLAKEKIWDKL